MTERLNEFQVSLAMMYHPTTIPAYIYIYTNAKSQCLAGDIDTRWFTLWLVNLFTYCRSSELSLVTSHTRWRRDSIQHSAACLHNTSWIIMEIYKACTSTDTPQFTHFTSTATVMFANFRFLRTSSRCHVTVLPVITPYILHWSLVISKAWDSHSIFLLWGQCL